MQRTSALDSAFLQLEDERSGLHIASVALFEGPAPSQARIRAALSRRLPRAPRLRQRLLTVPFSLGRPVWADDPDFDLCHHLRRVAVPAPGEAAELHAVVDDILSEHLAPDLPLWEDVVVEGLAHGRWALVTKVHHTMADGVSGTDLLSDVLEHSAHGDGPVPVPPWSPGPLPGLVDLALDALREQAGLRAREVSTLPPRVLDAARHPRRTLGGVWETSRGLAGFGHALAPVSPSSLVGPLGRARSYRWTEVGLPEVLQIRARLGGTLNDVVLAAVTRGYRALLLSRGEQPDPGAVRCLVPVSVRAPGAHAPDNQVSALLATLPVELDDVRDLVNEVAARTRRLKDSHEAETGQLLTAAADVVPAPALTAFLRLAFRAPHRHLTTVVTNVPGPRDVLYLAGRRMLAAYPYVPIADRLRTGVAITSYDGRLLLGITADRESTPDVEVLVTGIREGFDALAHLAGLLGAAEGVER